MPITARLEKGKVKLPLHSPQSKIRIADVDGNHISSPTQAKNERRNLVEWMITNREIAFLIDTFLNRESSQRLIEKMEKIKAFAEESDYSKRKSVRLQRERAESFAGFEIFYYTENFSSFEKALSSGVKVRITFKLGDYGVEPHPHMYVLIPFDCFSLKIKNNEGDVAREGFLGSGCYAAWKPTREDIEQIVFALAHASRKHKNALIEIIQPEP